MKQLISIEEMAMMAIAIYGISLLPIHISWWLYPILFLSPDISMLGYAVNNTIGAFTYNLFHHKAVAITVVAIGIISGNTYWLFTGLILFAHSAFDRMMGYGLKYLTGFSYTHLGIIGNKQKAAAK
ncbi:MAG: hypothetical protein BGO70_10010 [Bacteroidetes bacterium 43-93]|nr:DUF4260 domain-containing protein [Bacteroidota bacterium]OJX00492.1 MAG: hypothetical protein BGO70_10010 [Bacteroidetes bacterium 43-93]